MKWKLEYTHQLRRSRTQELRHDMNINGC